MLICKIAFFYTTKSRSRPQGGDREVELFFDSDMWNRPRLAYNYRILASIIACLCETLNNLLFFVEIMKIVIRQQHFYWIGNLIYYLAKIN